MHAFFVAVLVARGDELPHLGQQLAVALVAQGHPLLHAIPAWPRVATLGGQKPATGKVFSACNVRSLRGQGLLPIGASTLKAHVGDRRKVIGARQVKSHGLALRHQGQVQWLTADGEHMTAEAQGIAAIGHQFLLVAHGTQGKVSCSFKASVDVVRLHLGAQGAHVDDQGAQLGDQHVGGEIAVHILQARQLAHAPLRALEDAPRGVD